MPGELVPFTYDREAYNGLHGTNLHSPNELLDAADAERINNAFAIEVYVGVHGLAKHPNEAYTPLVLPTQVEYEAVKGVVDGLQPGDVLFMENPGFQCQPPEPVSIPDRLSTPPVFDITSFMHRLAAQTALRQLHAARDSARVELEQQRRNYNITAWDYARQLAALQGIRTVYADHDAFDSQAVEKLSGGKSLMDLATSDTHEDRILAERIHEQRERRACSVLKGWALDHLPAADIAPGGRKPRLVLVFGQAHQKGLEQGFRDLGLRAEITRMESTTIEGRLGEQLLRTLGGLLDYLTAPPDKRLK